MNILYVEDDPDDMLFFEQTVTSVQQAAKTFTAKSYVQMQELLEDPAVTFDMIFMDINLPIKNGHECLAIVKEYEKYRHTPVVVFSGSNSPMDVDKMYEAGASHYVIKPTKHNEYLEAFSKVFNKDVSEVNATSKSNFVIEYK